LNNGDLFFKPIMFCEIGHDLEFNNPRLFDAINYVQSIPYIINKEYYDFVKSINIVDVLSKTLYAMNNEGEMTEMKIAINKGNIQRLKDVKHIMDIVSEFKQYPSI